MDIRVYGRSRPHIPAAGGDDGVGFRPVAGIEGGIAGWRSGGHLQHRTTLQEEVMIVIHNFREAHRLYRQGSIPFRLLQEQAMVLIGFTSGSYIEEPFEIGNEEIELLLHDPDIAEEDYNGMLGGDVHVCESEADLQEIVGMDMAFAESHGNRWPNVTDQVMSWDQCAYLKQKDGNPEWALFLLCWNDAGGPVFYVHKHLWQAARVAEHIAETERHWG